MWQTITELPPTTGLQIGGLRLFTQLTKFCMWLVGRPSYTFGSSLSGSDSSGLHPTRVDNTHDLFGRARFARL